MADIRINALANTASSTASDDYLAVDGTTNGTRKLSAYSPTFGGNFQANGTGTIGGNLTVSGGTIGTAASTDLTLNGGSSGASFVLGQGTNGGSTLTAVGTGGFTFTQSGNNSQANTTFNSGGAIGVNFDFKRTTASASAGIGLFQLNGYNGSTRSAILEANSDGATDSGRFDFWVKATGGSLTQGMILKSNGNLLVGGTADGGQKLQVAGTGAFAGQLSVTVAGVTTAAFQSVDSGTGRSWQFGPQVGTGVGTDFNFYDVTAGGNILRMSSTRVQVPQTTASSSTTTGALVVSGGVGVAGAMYVGSGINVGSGSGLNSTGWLLYQSGTQFYVRDTVNGAMAMRFDAGAAPAANVINALSVGGSLTVSGIVQIADGQAIRNSNTSTGSYYFDSPNIEFRNPALSYATSVKLAGTGNFLVGTTVDSGAKLQVGTNTTTSAGGMMFGTDTALYRTAAGEVGLDALSGTSTVLGLRVAGTRKAYAYWESGTPTLTIAAEAASSSIKLLTANTLALTLDSSQRCILAGALRLNNAYTAGAPTATGYVTIQDSAGNTYKVLVGT